MVWTEIVDKFIKDLHYFSSRTMEICDHLIEGFSES